jgi:predicted small lipoprotein YifL
MRRFASFWIVVLAIPLAMMSGCGQKGALYLPPRNGAVITRPAESNTPPQGAPSNTDQSQATPQPNGSGQPDKKKSNESTSPPK